MVFDFKVICEDIGYVILKFVNKCLKSFYIFFFWINVNEICVMEGGSFISIIIINMLEEVYNLIIVIGKYLFIYVKMNIIYINLCKIYW